MSRGIIVESVELYQGVEYGFLFFFFQAEDGIRALVRSRGLGDVYKRQEVSGVKAKANPAPNVNVNGKMYQ
ncbi:hypothetical protein AMBR_BLFENHAL_02893 [Lacticaseibacillus rhamnosus]|nr:hypothetical protein AMBR_BLFENHAL_02893 [Lacticaseibacillus rhamnosus]